MVGVEEGVVGGGSGSGGRSAAILVFPSASRPQTQTTPPAEMPIPLITAGIAEGLSAIPYSYTALKVLPWILLIAALKRYFGGARNASERLMHSKVVMVTVGQSLSSSLPSSL